MDPFEILMIYYYVDGKLQTWVNPDVEQLAVWDDQHCDHRVHRVILSHGNNERLDLVVKYKPLEDFFNLYEFDENVTIVSRPTNVQVQDMVNDLLVVAKVVILEDVWSPGGEQFCFTDEGREIGKVVAGMNTVHFSPDIVFRKDPSSTPIGYWFDT